MLSMGCSDKSQDTGLNVVSEINSVEIAVEIDQEDTGSEDSDWEDTAEEDPEEDEVLGCQDEKLL